jgi:endonuclease/exonuclease/phosphatase family metal-dependent hydrolase
MLDVTKCFELNAHLNSDKIDIAVLNETWLKKSILDNEVFPAAQYKVFRRDRTAWSHPPDILNPKRFRRNGGGVMIAVRNDLDITSREIKLPSGTELLAVEFTTASGIKFIVCTCYRVGTLGMENHDKIVAALKTLSKRKKLSKIFVLGDFNLKNVDWSTLESSTPIEQSFVDSFVDLGLVQCISQPTHQKGNILDLLLTNSESSLHNLQVLDKDCICRSDHFPIKFDIKIKVCKRKQAKRVCYNFKKANWDRLNLDLCHTDWNAMLNRCEPELGWRIFKHRLFELANRHIPKAAVKSEGQPPWFDSECFEACRDKERLRAQYKQSKNVSDGLKFSIARKEFKKLMSQKMRDNLYSDDSDNHDLITKKFWSHVKTTSNSQRIPEFVTYNNSTIRSCPQDQAELFNSFFYEQFSDESLYNVDIDFSDDCRFDIDFNPTRVQNLLEKINSNKAHGPDGIHGKLLKKCAVGLAYPLSLLYKISYNTGILPEEWKLAHVVPIFKKGNKHEVENYRPISLTCLVMKIMERILKDEMLKHVGSLIDSRQHGFLAKKSCTTNLVGLCDSLALSLNENICSDVIYFDFAKAFDSVNHDLILHKLKNKFNVDGRLLKFMVSYLRDRQQRVIIGNKISTSKGAKSGVPQGSILGPLLFVLFINDITDGVSPGTNLSMYADDTKISRPIVDESDMIALQRDIDYLHDWSLRNKMKFHPHKCKVLSVNGKIPNPLLSVLPFTHFTYTLGEDPLDEVSSEKDLGVMVNSPLEWNEQCDQIYSRANQKLGLMKRTCHFVYDQTRRRILYMALVRSQFEHCSVIWRPLTKTKTTKLENLQKRAIKWILFEENISYASITSYIQKCRHLNILPLAVRFDFLDILFFYKVVTGLVPVELPCYLVPYSGNTRLRHSHLDHLCLVSTVSPRTTTNALAQGFFYRTHTKWNNLPLEVRELATLSEFKAKLLKFLWDNVLSELDEMLDEDYS